MKDEFSDGMRKEGTDGGREGEMKIELLIDEKQQSSQQLVYFTTYPLVENELLSIRFMLKDVLAARDYRTHRARAT